VKIWEYLAVTPEKFRTDYLETRLVDVATHPQFPLQMLTYGREAVHTNNWDSVIRKCRGIIFNIETDDIIARPFEKFFNLRTAGMPATDPNDWSVSEISDRWKLEPPEVWEKMDGFLCTMYSYNNKQYIASKGSFDSVHAKWATAWYQANVKGVWPEGYTPVFEGICSSIRIVVDYEKFEGLVLLAVINNETGEELSGNDLRQTARILGVETPDIYDLTWQGASAKSLDTEVENFEGYVLVWRRPGQTPFRLKVKYVDYLRLHRMVSGVSAKAIYRGLSDPAYKGELNEWINDSTPWFSKFVAKWVRALQGRHDELRDKADAAMGVYRGVLNQQYAETGVLPMKKDWAMLFQRPETKDVQAILFALYNDKDVEQVIWKLTKPLIKSSQPMIHGKDLL
jgi:RNA ligase